MYGIKHAGKGTRLPRALLEEEGGHSRTQIEFQAPKQFPGLVCPKRGNIIFLFSDILKIYLGLFFVV